MATIKKQFGIYELNDEVHRVRIGLKSKLQYETTAKARKWGDAEEQPFNAMAFWIWHAAKDRGLHELSFEDFIDEVVDIAVDDGSEDDEGKAEQDTPEV